MNQKTEPRSSEPIRWTVQVYAELRDGFFRAQACVGTPERMTGSIIFPNFSTEWQTSYSSSRAISYALAEAGTEIERRTT